MSYLADTNVVSELKNLPSEEKIKQLLSWLKQRQAQR